MCGVLADRHTKCTMMPQREAMLRSLSRVSLRFAAIASTLLATSLAFADDSVGNDEVTLKNGGSLRGTLISSEPGLSVKLLELGGKEPRVIPWADVDHVERGRFAG